MQIGGQLGLAKSTVSYHLNAGSGCRPDGDTSVGGWSSRSSGVAVCARASCATCKIGHLRLHDPDGARFRIPDAKTETGIREVQMTPDLVETVVEHLDRLRRIGAPTRPR